MKKLYRSETDKFLAGVIGGLGEFSSIDSTILRLGFLSVVVFTGFVPGIIFYIFAAVIVPLKPPVKSSKK